jgi:hypothetical protein
MQSNVMSDRLEAHFGPSTKTLSVRQVGGVVMFHYILEYGFILSEK